MKVIILNSKSGQQDLYTYGKSLLEELEKDYEVSMYNEVKPDFSNIPELFDEDEKLVLFNGYSFPKGFDGITKHLPSFKNIKFILSPYSSYEGLDLNLLKKMGIRYRNNAGANAKSVAQYATTCMLMLLSRFPELANLSKMPDGTILGEEFHNKTAGIIGMGNVGKELFKDLNGLGIKTVYYNRTSKDVDSKQVSIEDIFSQDIVFITIATNPETSKTLNNLSKLIKSHNYVIDVSAVDDLYNKKEIVELLEGDKFKGYALETEMELKSNKNFIRTPHIAWCTVDAERRTVVNYLDRALTILKGKTNEVDFIV